MEDEGWGFAVVRDGMECAFDNEDHGVGGVAGFCQIFSWLIFLVSAPVEQPLELAVTEVREGRKAAEFFDGNRAGHNILSIVEIRQFRNLLQRTRWFCPPMDRGIPKYWDFLCGSPESFSTFLQVSEFRAEYSELRNCQQTKSTVGFKFQSLLKCA